MVTLFRDIELRAIRVEEVRNVLIGDVDLRSDFALDHLLCNELVPEPVAHVGGRQIAPLQLLLKRVIRNVLFRLGICVVYLGIGGFDFQTRRFGEQDVLGDQIVEEVQFRRQRLLV